MTSHEVHVLSLLAEGRLDTARLFVAGLHSDFGIAVRSVVERWTDDLEEERLRVDDAVDGHCRGCRLKTCQGGLAPKP